MTTLRNTRRPLGETSAQRLLDSQWWTQVSPGTSSAHRETRHWVSQWVCQPGAHRSPVFSPGLCCFSHSVNHLPPSYPPIHCILLLSHQLNFMSSVTSSITLLSSSSSFLLVSVPIFIGWVMFCFVLQSRGYCGGIDQYLISPWWLGTNHGVWHWNKEMNQSTTKKKSSSRPLAFQFQPQPPSTQISSLQTISVWPLRLRHRKIQQTLSLRLFKANYLWAGMANDASRQDLHATLGQFKES